MPQISKEIIKKRAKLLREKGNKQLFNYLNKQIGKSTSMLVEQVKEKISYGKTQHFTKIKIDQVISEGKIVRCKINGVDADILQAKLI